VTPTKIIRERVTHVAAEMTPVFANDAVLARVVTLASIALDAARAGLPHTTELLKGDIDQVLAAALAGAPVTMARDGKPT
jgi:hypothetical protein